VAVDRLRAFIRRLFGAAASTPAVPPHTPARLVVGLGNPGPQYADTRHNAGFLVVERLADRQGAAWSEDAELEARVAQIELGGEACLLLQPQTFMNASGRSVEIALERWPELDPASDLLIVYDELDLPPGRIRLRPSGGGGGHNGIGDVLTVLATKAVPRLRFGVGRPVESGRAVIDYVLAPFGEDELGDVIEPAIERAADAVEMACTDGVTSAMGRFNASK